MAHFQYCKDCGNCIEECPKGVFHFVITFTNFERKMNRKGEPEGSALYYTSHLYVAILSCVSKASLSGIPTMGGPIGFVI